MSLHIIFAKHDGNPKEYCWYISERKAKYVRKGDLLLVETSKGDKLVTATTDPICGNECLNVRKLAEMNGATFPLKRVAGFANKQMVEYITDKVQSEIHVEVMRCFYKYKKLEDD